ncbi:alpha/beta hydrolase [Candidatus Saccharibacteria bacterium]|nr:alpha/beta hydrolase [Candidatus Saccharibacteria bacterium]
MPEFLPTVTEPGLAAINAIRQPSFDSQWLTARKIKVEKKGSPARYTDLRPEDWEDNPTVLIADSWSVGKGRLKEVARGLYEDGRRVIIADPSKYEYPRPKIPWSERREQIKAAATNAGEWLKTAKDSTKECLKEFALKVRDNAKMTVAGERPPRPQPTWDDEYLRIKTALTNGGRRLKAALSNAGARMKTAIAERRARTKTLPEDLHPVVAGQVEALIDIIDDSCLEQVEIVSDSTGSLATLIAAQRRPELFNKLVLAMPAGAFEVSVESLLKRFRPKLGQRLTKDADNPKVNQPINLGSLIYALKQPFKSYRDIETITSARARKALADLSKREDIKVAVLQANSNLILPPEDIERSISTRRGDRDSKGRWRKSGELLVDAYSILIDRRAGHYDFVVNPKDSTAAVLDILKHM